MQNLFTPEECSNVTKKLFTAAAIAAVLAGSPLATWACEGAGPATHIGKVTSIDAAGKKFTIKDVQSQGPITFSADDDVIKGVQGAKGMVTVKYQEKDGGLTAVGVTY
jgi:hypothetical protein